MSQPKVFVSSTYVDLQGLRAQLGAFITEFGLTPVLFEKGGIYFDWTSPLDESCYSEIPLCDIYVLIIGGRYGSPSGKDLKKKGLGIKKFNSVTKNEYLTAKNAEMPIFIFIDSRVYTTYETYNQNGRRLDLKYAYIDDPQVFRLLDHIYSQGHNNFVQPFTSIDDITTYLRHQWVGMLHDYIRRKQLLKVIEGIEVHVNAYKLFYFRRVRSISPNALSNLSGVDREEIRKLKRIKRRHGKLDITQFAKCSPATIRQLEEALACPSELTANGHHDFLAHFMEYYRLYKSKPIREDEGKPELPFPTKAVFFDFDGTLTKTSDTNSSRDLTTWERLWLQLGYTMNQCGKYHDQYTRKQITHKEWCDITRDYFVRAGMTEDHIFQVADAITLIPDAIETLRYLQASGIKLYIISGSIITIIKRVLGQYMSIFSDIRANNMIFDAKDPRGLQSIIGTEYDFEGKANFIREKLRENAFSPLEVLFVGNSVNDIYAARSGARTLCVNPSFTNGGDIRHWHYCIKEMQSLKMICDYLKLPEQPSFSSST